MALNITKEDLERLIGDKFGDAATLITTECSKMNVKIDKLGQKVVDLTTSVDALTEENTKLTQMLQAFIKEDHQKNAISTGLFSNNLSPYRGVMPFSVTDSRRKGPNGEEIYRSDVFSWNHLKLSCDKVLGDMEEDSMAEDVFEGCKSNVDSKMISAVVGIVWIIFYSDYDINNETTWAKTDPRVQMQAILMLEAEAAPFSSFSFFSLTLNMESTRPNNEVTTTEEFPFPPEIWALVARYLRIQDLYALSGASKDSYRNVNNLNIWSKALKKLKIKSQPGISGIRALKSYKTYMRDICFLPYDQRNGRETLSIYHNDFDCRIRACLECRRNYFVSFPEVLHYQFKDGWFPAKDLRDVLKLPEKVIKDINKTKTAPHPSRRSNQDILLYDGDESLQSALAFHGGYVGLLRASDEFKRQFNVSKELYLFNLNQCIHYDTIANLFKKYGIITKFAKTKGCIEIDIMTNASYSTMIKYINTVTFDEQKLVATTRR